MTPLLPGVVEGLRLAVISPDGTLRAQLEETLRCLQRVAVAPQLARYATDSDLAEYIEASAPAVVLIDMGDLREAFRVSSELQVGFREMPLIGLAREYDADTLLGALRAGMREILRLPLEVNDTISALERLSEILRRNPPRRPAPSEVLSFLPSKAGAGASTVSLNVAALAAEQGERVVLADLDLNGGLISFMMKLQEGHDIRDAASIGEDLDDQTWDRIVSKRGKLSILPAGKLRPNAPLGAHQMAHLLSFLRGAYRTVFLDHSGGLEEHSLAMLPESSSIFLVTTPEVISLHAARRRLKFLEEMGLGERTRVIVNRIHAAAPLKLGQIEDILEVPVFATVPNGYAAVQAALDNGTCVSATSILGKRFDDLAKKLLGLDAPRRQTKRPLLSRLSFFRDFEGPQTTTGVSG